MAKLTNTQTDKKEKIVKSMKKNIGDFKNRYGDDAKSVMYATATKLSQKESLQYVAGFDTSSNAYEFARKLKSYGIAEHIVIDKSVYINTVNVMFETGIDNESFVSWLCEHNIGTGISMMYENILPDPQHFTDPITRRTYTDFRQEKSSIVYDLMFKDALLPEAEDAYKKTRAYKKLKPDEKKAIDFFMSEVETQGINNLEKVYKQTTVRYSIKTSTLDAFMENIFFDEDIAYIKSIQTIISEEDKANTNAQKDMDAAKEKVDKDKETAETKKADTKKKSDERKAKSVEDTKAKTADADKSKEADAPEKTFKNFKSDLKPGQKGPPAITKNKDEEEVKMDKPVKGSPIDDSPEMDSGIDEATGSASQIAMLKKAYGGLNTINPASPTYTKLVALLDGLMKTDPRLLKQIAGAKIKFVSVLAANRVRRLNESTLILKDGEYLKKGHPVKWKAADGKEVQGTVDSHQSGRYIDAVKVTKSKSRFYKPGDYADDVHLRDTGIKYEFEFDA